MRERERGMGWGYGRILGGVGDFSSHIRFEVGVGSKIRFWHEPWCGDKALKEAFLDLYGITCVKDASVVAHLVLFGDFN
jgi:hypothetical protein